VRVRVRCSHRGPSIFEHLHPAILVTELFALPGPGVNYRSNPLAGKFRERKVVARRKAKDTAGSRNDLPLEQGVVYSGRRKLHVGQQGREFVGEAVRAVVGRIEGPAGACVAWAEVTPRVVRPPYLGRNGLPLALPGTLGPVWGDEDPLAGQRVIPPVWGGFPVGWLDASHRFS